VIQLHTFWGFFSFDDLFTNTLGGLIGAGLYKIIYRPEREGVLKYITIACIAILVPLTVYAVIRTGMDMEFYLSLATRTYR
jgi:glycopeptide antibiotics resistance protein